MYYYALFISFIAGLAIGSFLNCLIWRLHEEKTILGRSMCTKCKKIIAWYDNIPLLSFIILRGKCRHCGAKISWQYPVVEFFTAVLFVMAMVVNLKFVFFNFYSILNFETSQFLTSYFFLLTLKSWFIISVMTIIFIYDLKWYLILDIVTLPACAIIFALNFATGQNWQNLLISGIIGASFFLIQFVVSRGKWIGGGDIRLGLLMGLTLGWPMVLVAIFLAYIIGSIVGIFLLLTKKKSLGSQIPLGIFLAPATIIVLFWGEGILQWYWGGLM